MGNCQAADSSMVVIQHPRGGRIERLYWPISASEVMRSNPGHYVALVTMCETGEDKHERNGVRFTRVKLLRPKDILVLGRVYRLVTSQEVMKGLWAKKYERMRKNQSDSMRRQEKARDPQDPVSVTEGQPEAEKNQVAKQESHRPKQAQLAASSSKHWRPSLQSISELTI